MPRALSAHADTRAEEQRAEELDDSLLDLLRNQSPWVRKSSCKPCAGSGAGRKCRKPERYPLVIFPDNEEGPHAMSRVASVLGLFYLV